MKTKIQKIALMAIAGMLHTAGIFAQNNDLPEGDEKKLTLKIQVSANQSNLNDVTVKIYDDHKRVIVLSNGNPRNMKIELINNSYYVIEVSSLGYISKSFLISTVFPADTLHNNDDTPYEHKISISLNKEGGKKIKHIQLTGIVFFDQGQDDFLGLPLIKEPPNKQGIIVQIENWLDSDTEIGAISKKTNSNNTGEGLLSSEK